ncbi:hypothetical protein [Nonomuraea endophytica]|uniref:hypothetical protein n=1 Tax=Nonomuraea endophytica TaxID=714136 RepID=UPI0037CAB083
METDTATDARQRLERLREELAASGWHCELANSPDPPTLRVSNPRVPAMADEIVYTNGYCWAWGPHIGHNPQDVAQVVRHVLREVSGP